MASGLERTISALRVSKYNLSDQKMLIKSLECLKDTVGNEHIKETIVNSVNSPILYKDTRGDLSARANLMDVPKLHTVIYGSPGTGKTLLAKILASIWTSIGLIDVSDGVNAKESKKRPKEESIRDFFQLHGAQNLPLPNLNASDIILMCVIAFAMYKLVQMLWEHMDMSRRMDLRGHEALALQLLIVVACIFSVAYVMKKARKHFNMWLNSSTKDTSSAAAGKGTHSRSGSKATDAAGPRSDEPTDAEVEVRTNFFEKYADVLDSDKVVLASPTDFIGQFLGFTAEKTRAFLNKHLGKVVFVDEAYGFIPKGDHMYGRQALNEITSFIDAHHGKIVLIFAGYEDLLRKGVFEVQKGLDRRFGMHITCTGYSHAELFEMLINKIGTRGMRLSDREGCFREFQKGRFAYYAGDIDTLSDYLREPLAEAYVVNKARSPAMLPKKADASEDAGLGDDDSETSSEAADLYYSMSTFDGVESSDEGYADSRERGGRVNLLLRDCLIVSPQIMRDAVIKLNSRRDSSESRNAANAEGILNLLMKHQ